MTVDATHRSVDGRVAPDERRAVAEGDLQRTVGANLRRLRIERGRSQEAFADELGFHRTYVGGVERGERNLTLRSVERLAAILDVDPMALLAGPAEPVTPPS